MLLNLVWKATALSAFICLYISTITQKIQNVFQNHPQKYEKLIRFHSYTATANEKFVGSSGIWTRTFGFLDRRSTHWAIKSTGIGGESYLYLNG